MTHNENCSVNFLRYRETTISLEMLMNSKTGSPIQLIDTKNRFRISNILSPTFYDCSASIPIHKSKRKKKARQILLLWQFLISSK